MNNTLNLHNIVGNALACVNAWKIMKFTKTKVEWDVSSRDPINVIETVEVKGKLQPVNTQDVEALGFDVNTYQYFKIYLSGTPTQLDRVRQLGSDTFICENLEYHLTGIMPWDDEGWRKGFCYLDKKIKEDNES